MELKQSINRRSIAGFFAPLYLPLQSDLSRPTVCTKSLRELLRCNIYNYHIVIPFNCQHDSYQLNNSGLLLQQSAITYVNNSPTTEKFMR